MMGRRPLKFRSIQFLVFLGSLWALPAGLTAQDHDHHQRIRPPPTPGWAWTADANVIFGYNYQQRRFADFWAWESQNWVMLSGTRTVGPGRLTVTGMLSARAVDDWPVTSTRKGVTAARSGCTRSTPSASGCLSADRRRPSRPERATRRAADQLSASARSADGARRDVSAGRRPGEIHLRRRSGRLSGARSPRLHASRVGARQSADAADASFHRLDAHTPGVVTLGVEAGPMTFEASAFRGLEPDENPVGHRIGRGSTPGRRVPAGAGGHGRRSFPAAT